MKMNDFECGVGMGVLFIALLILIFSLGNYMADAAVKQGCEDFGKIKIGKTFIECKVLK
jgi:hypothetical protein